MSGLCMCVCGLCVCEWLVCVMVSECICKLWVWVVYVCVVFEWCVCVCVWTKNPASNFKYDENNNLQNSFRWKFVNGAREIFKKIRFALSWQQTCGFRVENIFYDSQAETRYFASDNERTERKMERCQIICEIVSVRGRAESDAGIGPKTTKYFRCEKRLPRSNGR